MTAYEINGKDYEVEYDLDNRIIKVEVNNSDVEYRYDAFGRRIIRQKGSTKSALIWWGNSENAEHKHQAGQTVIQNDIMAHPSRLNSVIARAKDGSKFKLEWYHKNYLDHVYAVSDDTGDILEHYRYTAFGQVTIYDENGALVTETQIDNHILWNTRRRDEVTGYYIYKFRHYSAELGRWPSRDPIEEDGGINLYGVVGNDGINDWDRLGLTACKCDCSKAMLKDLSNDLNKIINALIKARKGNMKSLWKDLVPQREFLPNITGIETILMQRLGKHMLDFPKNIVEKGQYAPCMNLCGQCVGTDKIGHFFEEGRLYQLISDKYGKGSGAKWGEWTEGVKGSSDPTAAAGLPAGSGWSGNPNMGGKKIPFGSFGDHHRGLGVLPTGRADLEANLAGETFWNDLRKNGVKTKFNICDYITEKWDENKNPNTKD